MSGETKWPKDAGEYAVSVWAPAAGSGYDELYICGGPDGDDILCTFERADMEDGEHAETEALAQLYASAPRLYAALEALLNAFPVDPVGYIDPARVEASAALAAARGETTP